MKQTTHFFLEDESPTLSLEVVVKQIIGIAMVSIPALFIVILFLSYYGNKWILETGNSNLKLEELYGNNFRFIDDLIAIIN